MSLLGLTLFMLSIDSLWALHPNDPRAYLSKEAFNQIDLDHTWIHNNVSETVFHLYVNGEETPFQFNAETNPEELLKQGFDPRKPTNVLAHGWVAPPLEFCGAFGNAFNLDKVNVICIDYGPLATADNYFQAALNAVNVGQFAGENLGVKILLDGLGQSPDQIHMIGHSLGAHAAGQFGRMIFNLKGTKISRVTGLDPAKPFFDYADEEYKININDAVLVDIMHTNSGTLQEGALSLPEPLGHLDFYPNGGTHQAGCTDLCIGSQCLDFDLLDIFKRACSHGRSNKYYVESVYSLETGKPFMSTKCDSYVEFLENQCSDDSTFLSMGEKLEVTNPDQIEGGTMKMYLLTNGEEPFSMS